MVRRLLRSGTHHRETRSSRTQLHRPSPYWASDGRLRRERDSGEDFVTSFWHNEERWQNITRRHPMKIHTFGIDLGKTSFHLAGLTSAAEVIVRKRFSRAQLLRFTANRKVHVIGMEACGGAHYLGRALQEQAHQVRLIPAQYVKPYVKTNKSDYIDAEAIAEAVGRPTMRFVPIKSDDQLDLQSLHRVRERWGMRRTAVLNQIRGLLLERGITLRKGRRYIDEALPGIVEDADAKLSGTVRLLLAQLKLELDQLALHLEH